MVHLPQNGTIGFDPQPFCPNGVCLASKRACSRTNKLDAFSERGLSYQPPKEPQLGAACRAAHVGSANSTMRCGTGTWAENGLSVPCPSDFTKLPASVLEWCSKILLPAGSWEHQAVPQFHCLVRPMKEKMEPQAELPVSPPPQSISFKGDVQKQVGPLIKWQLIVHGNFLWDT